MRPRPEGRGEPGVTPAALAALAGFNAATTRRPWRTTAPKSIRRGRSSASMRPRPEGRGEPIEADPCDRPSFNAATARRPWRTNRRWPVRQPRLELQCGHGPKAVENHVVTFAAGVTAALQCGHGPKAVENSNRRSVERGDARHASMRPRPEGRGEPRTVAYGRIGWT